MKRGDYGTEVCALQVKLQQLGLSLPRWGADGKLGTETLDALAIFLRQHAAERDDDADDVSPEELALVDRIWGATVGGLLAPPIANYHDIRGIAAKTADGGPRSWASVTGFTLHQTACYLGESLSRWSTVGAHLGCTRAGKVIHLHDFDRVIWHGNGFNAKTIGIECDGLYAGIEGDPRTVWDDPSTGKRETAMTPTKELIEAAKQAIRWGVKEVARHGGKVTKLVAHRQSSGARQNDPGSALWQAVALPMMADLGLDDGGPGFKIGTGRAIPEEWDPTRKGYRY